MSVVGGGGAALGEVGAASGMGLEVAFPRARVLARERAQLHDIVGEARVVRVHRRVRAIGGDHAPGPAARAYRVVMCEQVERRFGGCDHFDVETLEQRAWTKFRLLERARYALVNR